ncbi:simple sugar transport system ATP-binding protein [Loktanella sp. DSM 29012]|uniref:ABC transporter ATP-binding protein n=1 Tax=Loktanella sp. DSM 29012 TaxID=1881056 RepID=UPI0008D7D5D1|nr:ABC transporter ATP-binding protein [Loktanella sp. DSM 29012]SEP77156.1 simple sugar transport system ATP-binding protein [Loktanella sp. DSM 29012]
MRDTLLNITGLTKAYGSVIANREVSFSVGVGEIHALLGENGAGKSTLVKTIYGLVKPDSGTMDMRGAPFAPTDPAAARKAGVGMVFQHFSLFDALTVAENIVLGMDNPPSPRAIAAEVRRVSDQYGLPLDPDQIVGDLSAGERQRVEIIRCLLQNPKLLIMDEPTSVLTPQEVEILFKTLRKLAAEGTSILYISHKLSEIAALCEAATILRMGQVVATCDPRTTAPREMAELMVGQVLQSPVRAARPEGAMALELTGLSAPASHRFGTALRDIRIAVRAGEVLGIGGVAGNGQDELVAVLSGETMSDNDAVLLDGKPVGRSPVNARRALGLLCAPEERLGHAAAPDMSLTENAAVTAITRKSLTRRGFVDWPQARAFASAVIAQFDVRTPGPQHTAASLSGGNLQKFVIGREIMQAPRVLVVNQPTWGVDAAAAAAIRQALLTLADEGAAVVVISQDLDELMEISDRFCALTEGRLSAPRAARGLTVDQIGMMLGGAHDMEVAHVAE